MKTVNHVVPLMALFVIISLGSCIRNNEIINGNGTVVDENRTITSFTALDVSGSYKILFSLADTFSLQISAESNLLPRIVTKVENNRLIVRTEKGFSLLESKPMIIKIAAPTIKDINMSGSSQFVCEEIIETSSFKASLSGSCKIETGVNTNQMESNLSGSGSVKITGGSSQVSKYNISGSATITALEHSTKIANIRISGSGTVWLQVSDHLDVNISGSGEVNYLGNPTIESSISGSGRINKL